MRPLYEVVSRTLFGSDTAVTSADGLGKNDPVWFPRWLRRYAMSFPKGLFDELPVNHDSTLRFSRSLLATGLRCNSVGRRSELEVLS